MLAGIAGISALADNAELAAVLAIGVAALTATTTFLNAGDRAQAHTKKRAQYEELRNSVRFFRTVTIPLAESKADLVKELARHARTRNILNSESPQARKKAFDRAATLEEARRRRATDRGETSQRRRSLVARLLRNVTTWLRSRDDVPSGPDANAANL